MATPPAARPLLLPLLAGCLAACAASPVELPPDGRPPGGTGWTQVDTGLGPTWTWDADPTLRVWPSRDPAQPGLHVAWGERSLSVPWDGGEGPVALPVLLVSPRADGTPPLDPADDRPGLHLRLAGSAEHGCPVDDLTLDLRASPEPEGDAVRLEILLSGVPYLALPADGETAVVDAAGTHVVDGAAHVVAAGDLQCADAELLLHEGPTLGQLWLGATGGPVPWLQLQGHPGPDGGATGGLLEVDLDHSCEDPDWEGAELVLVAWL